MAAKGTASKKHTAEEPVSDVVDLESSKRHS